MKLNAIICDNGYDTEINKPYIKVCCVAIPEEETFTTLHFQIDIVFNGTESAQEINSLIASSIKDQCVKLFDIQPSNADILVTKFT